MDSMGTKGNGETSTRFSTKLKEVAKSNSTTTVNENNNKNKSLEPRTSKASCMSRKDLFRSTEKAFHDEMLNKLVVGVEGTHITDDSKDSESLRNRVGTQERKGKLLVLDLNGILVDVVFGDVPKGYKPDMTFRGRSVFKRPFCDDFLKFCFEKFDVGVWSSRTKNNVDDLITFIMGEMQQRLLFCWDASKCTKTGLTTIENNNKPVVLKELKKLWEKHGEYNQSNTVLLDDTPYKALRNPPYTTVFPLSFTMHDRNDNSLGPGGDLRLYLEGLALAEDVQEYIEKNPFGQSNKTPTLDYYKKMISLENF